MTLGWDGLGLESVKVASLALEWHHIGTALTIDGHHIRKGLAWIDTGSINGLTLYCIGLDWLQIGTGLAED